MAEQTMDPVFRVLNAQQRNIARIATDLILPGTDGQGNQIALHGPRPTLIRLYDQPLRLAQQAVLDNWERIITLMPLQNTGSDAIVSRNDRIIRYVVHALVRLTEKEIRDDHNRVAEGGIMPESVLAGKMMRLAYDLHHVFYDDLDLAQQNGGCPMVTHASYECAWDQEVAYPQAMFAMAVTARVDAY